MFAPNQVFDHTSLVYIIILIFFCEYRMGMIVYSLSSFAICKTMTVEAIPDSYSLWFELCVTVCPLNMLVTAPCKYNKSWGVREDVKQAEIGQ